MGYDPTGEAFMFLTAAIGAIVGSIVGGCVAAANGGSVLAGVCIGAAAGGLIGLGAGAAAGVLLAGSATASTAAVVSGAGTLATTVATGGTGAGITYIVNNINNACSSTVTDACTAIQTYYPPNDGFSGTPQRITLDSGTLLQRTGSLYGRFVAPYGTPSQMLSLPYDKIGAPTTYLQLTKAIEVTSGKVAPWFGQCGGGTQYVFDSSVKELIKEGIVKIIEG